MGNFPGKMRKRTKRRQRKEEVPTEKEQKTTDGEQMVLSGPEAAALLAQAGISLGDQEQVMMGGGRGKSIIKQHISISSRILLCLSCVCTVIRHSNYLLIFISLPSQCQFFI